MGAERANHPDFRSPQWDRRCTEWALLSVGEWVSETEKDVCVHAWGFLWLPVVRTPKLDELRGEFGV